MSEVLTPKQIIHEGQTAYRSGDFLAAAQAYQAAADSYRLAGDMILAAEMLNNQSVALLQAGNAQAALDVVEGTLELFQAEEDYRRQAIAAGNQAAALEALGRLDEAIEKYSLSAQLFKEIGEHDLRATVLQSLSALQLRTGKSLQALATMQAGMSELEKPDLRQRMVKRLLDIPFKMLNRK